VAQLPTVRLVRMFVSIHHSPIRYFRPACQTILRLALRVQRQSQRSVLHHADRMAESMSGERAQVMGFTGGRSDIKDEEKWQSAERT